MGHILFILYSGYLAFNEATLKNPLYNFLLQDKPDVFWRYHDKKVSQIPGFFTPTFKKLLIEMIHPDPSKRATIEKIKDSDWYKETSEATLA